ncbi:MAG: hypothetical protein AAGD25_19870 [Cyanobacteria bacterium P01_F01_bin.150]
MRDLRSLVLIPFSVRIPNLLYRPSTLPILGLGFFLGLGNSSGVLAQSIPILPPLAPASLDVDDLILEEADESIEGNETIDEADSDESSDLNLNEPSVDDLANPESSNEQPEERLEQSEEALEEELNLPSPGELSGEELNPNDLPLSDTLDESADSLSIPFEAPNEGSSPSSVPTSAEWFKPGQGGQIFEDAVLSPGAITSPVTLRGISGGPLTASRVAGRTDTATGICTGFVDQKPDHRLELTEFFDYLSLQVESPEDTVLVVRGPGGSWCNDDVMGFNPGLAGEWFSGVYDVWVGSYNEQTYHPYVIRLSDTQ